MTIETLVERRRLRRKVQGIAAALLPFDRLTLTGEWRSKLFRVISWPRIAPD